MADDAIRKLCDGEELVLADEQRAPSLNVAREADPRAATVERRHRALAGRSPEPRRPFASPAPPLGAAPR
jgi:hypothetical protein